ncbi:MAG: DUF421 domain-containing protein [Bacteroidota bacterium]|nr:DUF421 domain-containing protein [Bacteroidota bacterium]
MQAFLLEINWKVLLLGEEQWSFIIETVFRTTVMFLFILLSLRFLGKRGIKQLSVFELGVIIGLGSAAGDPMFYKDVGLLLGFIVLFVIVGLYKIVTYFINKNEGFEQFVEGKPTYIVTDGKILIQNFRKEPIARDELYMQLRLNDVSHLGQIEQVILETNGELSVLFYDNEEVKYGLPILPHLLNENFKNIPTEDVYACSNCGHTLTLQPSAEVSCTNCSKKIWIKAINKKRID